ncbi:hypothetical protein EsH8_XIV_000026 [Colletotrichum jinshuiense]
MEHVQASDPSLGLSLGQDENALVSRLVDIAVAIASGHAVPDDQFHRITQPFRLPSALLHRFVELLAERPIQHDKLRLEYDYSSGTARIKMESNVHSNLSGRISDLVADAARPVLRLIKLYNYSVKLNDGSRFQCDASWSAFDAVSKTAHVVAEVARSSPKTLKELEDKCVSWILRTDASVRAAIGIKIFYDPGNAKLSVLDNLHRCFVGL